jgi:ribose-phosphate pyrophosphokinase
VKSAEVLSTLLGASLAIVEKRRISDTEVIPGHIIGDVSDKTVILYDDMISTAGSMANAIKVCKEAGARQTFCMATHALLVGDALDKLKNCGVTELIVSDTLPKNFSVNCGIEITTLSVAGLIGKAIERIHTNRSISALFRTTEDV